MTELQPLFLRHLAQTSDEPLLLEITHAKGCVLFGPEERSWLDLISGISVSNMGHGHPDIVQAVQEQAAKYMHVMVYGEFVESPQVQYATWLANHLPGEIDSVYFVNSGSEAVEGAIKLAKRATCRTEIVSFQHGYHGSTAAALATGGNEERKRAFRPLPPDNLILPFNDINSIGQISHRTAAVLVELIQGEAGIRPADEAFIQELAYRCRVVGALLIVDECQTGFGRTGKMFAAEHYDLKPDIMILGKALGGGMPLGAFAAGKDLMQKLTTQPVLGHITTFGGHPVCCAAGLASASLITTELLQQVEEKGKFLEEKLHHPAIKEIRRRGLMMVVDLPDEPFNKAVIRRMITKGVVTDWFLFHDNGLRIAPPLVITVPELEFAARLLLESLDEVQKELHSVN